MRRFSVGELCLSVCVRGTTDSTHECGMCCTAYTGYVGAAMRRTPSQQAYYERNRESINAKRRENLANDPSVRVKNRQWRTANREHIRSQSLAWKRANPDKVRASARKYRQGTGRFDHWRDWYLRHQYGIGSVEYDAMLARQDGRCAICRRPETERVRSGRLKLLTVDHDHKCCPGKTSCGKCVRGLLCSRHNTAIGMLDDDPALLDAAAAYLRSVAANRNEHD